MTGAMNRYPRRGNVSIKRGLSAESPSASRSLLIAVFRLFSKSTKVSGGQFWFRSSSRVTTSPVLCSSTVRTRNGCSCSLILTPCLRSSPDRRSTWKVANRTTPEFCVSKAIDTPPPRYWESSIACTRGKRRIRSHANGLKRETFLVKKQSSRRPLFCPRSETILTGRTAKRAAERPSTSQAKVGHGTTRRRRGRPTRRQRYADEFLKDETDVSHRRHL